jgi:glycosyltransferase involved in cell wall biosynthesis
MTPVAAGQGAASQGAASQGGSALRVLHVIGGGDTGGAMGNVLPLLKALRAQGCDARLLCLGGGGLAEEARRRRVPTRVLPMRSAWDAGVLPGLWRSLRDEPWDVVHTHGMRANLPVRLLAPSLRLRPCLFTTVHSDLAFDYVNGAQARVYLFLDRLSAPAVDVFFCVSADLAGRIAARGFDPRRLQVMYPGVEESAAQASFSQERPAEASPAGPAPPTAGTVARLVGVKDLGLLLEAARILVADRRDLRVVIVGDGPDKAALERLASELGLGSVADFRGEVRPAWSAMREFDVYVLTSFSEGMPISVLEAMTIGLSVVATAVGGLPEMVEDGVSGYLVPRGDDRGATARALADRIGGLLADPGLRARVGLRARERAERCFSAEAAAARVLKAYQRCGAGRAAESRRLRPGLRGLGSLGLGLRGR